MERLIRIVVTTLGVFALVWTVAVLADLGWARDLWVWPAAPRLNLVFVASVAAALGCVALWVALRSPPGLGRAATLQLTVMCGGGAATLFLSEEYAKNPRVATFAVLAAISFAGGVALFLFAHAHPFPKGLPLPRLLRWSLLVFALVLLGAGLGLVLGASGVFPWRVKPLAENLYGWVFLASVFFFGHAFVWPTRENVVAQLLAFLAYDLVLIVPFVAHFSDVLPEYRTILIIYVAILVSSGSISAYYLFVHPDTRIVCRSDRARAP